MQQLQTELLQLFALGKENQRTIIKQLDQIIDKYDMKKIKAWRNYSNKYRNTLLHELVEMELSAVVHHVLTKYKLSVNIRRESDNMTLFQLAYQNKNTEMCNLLKSFGGDQVQVENNHGSSTEVEKKMNIVWLDLEMTSLDDPEILECAVIITDKDLNELKHGKLSFSCFVALSKWEFDVCIC